jgi:3-hydroxyisobutyrate dehydrogenase-like beta-hydroxyacid dehydrogenase
MRVGVIGLGLMGSAIAARLLAVASRGAGPGAGSAPDPAITVYDLRPEAMAVLVAAGATGAATPAALAAGCDLVLLSLNTAEVVGAVLNGPDGLLAGAAPGALVVDMSSIAPGPTRALARTAQDAGVRWLDAPLSGGAPAVAVGRLTLMVGGEPADLDRARPVLDRLATRITHLGPVGSGQVAKLVNQVLVGVGFGALAEAAALVRAEGLPAERVLDALTGGRADSVLLQEFFVKFASADPAPTGRVDNMVKDLDTAGKLGRLAGVPLPLTSLVVEQNRWLVARGLGGADNAAMMNYYDHTAAVMPLADGTVA